MARGRRRKNNREPQKWLMMGLYPLALLIIFLGVSIGSSNSASADNGAVPIQDYDDQDANEILRKLNIEELDKGEVIKVEDLIDDENQGEDLTEESGDYISGETEPDYEDETEESYLEDDTVFEGCYYYATLSDAEKEIYYSLYKGVDDLKEHLYIENCKLEQVEHVYYLMLGDHPELFYVSTGFRYNEQTTGVHFWPQYSYDEGKILSRRVMNEGAADEIIASMNAGISEYEIIEYLYSYIVENTSYDLGSEDNQEISSVLLNHVSVCTGYAKTMQYLLQKLGMQALYVTGEAGGGLHAWLIVRVDDEYYQLDVCWADNLNPDVPHPDYAYLCLSTDLMSRTHTIESYWPVPQCSKMDANFYVQENLYVTDLNDAVLQEMFDRSRLEYNGTVYLMACDDRVYKALISYLIDENYAGEFYFADRTKRYTYFTNDNLRTISIYK